MANEENHRSGIVYVSADIETDGQIVGVNSMLSLGSAAFSEDGEILSCFAANLLEEEGGERDPVCMHEFWSKHPREWEAARAGARPIREVMAEYSAWVKRLPGAPVFVAYPANFDFGFVQNYLLRFAGECPFGYCALDMKSFAAGLLGWSFEETTESRMPRHWFEHKNGTPHVALSDAIAQGHTFMAMLRDSKALAAQLAEARAALEAIAALQVGEPVDNVRCGYDAYADGHDDGWSQGRYEAAELARKALGGGK